MRPQQKFPPESTRPTLRPAAVPRDLTGPFEVTLPAELNAPAAARAALSAWMAGHVTETTLADAQLLVGELVANSVRHAHTAADAVVSVRGHVCVDVVRLEVEDSGSTGSIARRAPDLQRGGGFGLNVVEVVSARWGVNRDRGTRVWAEIALPPAQSSVADPEPAMPPASDQRPDARHAAASAARARAADARDRALAAREAAERTTTEYAQGVLHRVADLQGELARSHEDVAQTLRRANGRGGA
jgi:serine/threonine-protein kinase RsbW